MATATSSRRGSFVHERDGSIPYFTVGGDGGVVLHPAHNRVLCGYGIDGSTDFNKPNHCDPISSQCVPGCGEPPSWCDRASPNGVAGGSQVVCGFGWGSAGVQPWHPADLGGNGGLLDLFARFGAAYPNDDVYSGYNEIIVANAEWVSHLPGSVEAIFVIEGRPQAGVRQIHRRYLETYGLTEDQFPLLVLRTTNWSEPFVAA